MSLEENFKSNRTAAFFPKEISQEQFEMIEGMMDVDRLQDLQRVISDIWSEDLEALAEYGDFDQVASYLLSVVVKTICENH